MSDIVQDELLLFGALTRVEIRNYIIGSYIKEETEEIKEILQEWKTASNYFLNLLKPKEDSLIL